MSRRNNFVGFGKQGQFYIFAVIILLSLVFVMVPRQTQLTMPKEGAKNLFLQYQKEAPYFVNAAYLAGDAGIVSDYTQKFVDFAFENGFDFSATTIFCSQNNLTIFATAVNTSVGIGRNYDLPKNTSITLPRVSFINITMDDEEYPFSLRCPDFAALFITKGAGKSKKVFIYE